MANSELVKLGIIIGGGLLILVLGFLFQSWKHKRNAEKALGLDPFLSSPTSFFQENPQIKAYILKYKTDYSKEQIKTALLEARFDSKSVDEHLNRFYS